MQPSPNSISSAWMSRSEYVSTLPLWRRLLAMLNWRPVYDIEQETKRYEDFNSRLDAILQNFDSTSPTHPETDCN